MDEKIRRLEHALSEVKAQLATLGEFRPGTLTEQMNVCGNPGCACKGNPPKKHGPYYQLSYTRGGKGTSRFVRQGEVGMVRRQVKEYARFRELIAQWIDLAMQLAEARIEALRRSVAEVADAPERFGDGRAALARRRQAAPAARRPRRA